MTRDSFQDPSSLWVISETRKTGTPILRTKGEWGSWEGREQFPLLHRSRVTALTRLCRPQKEKCLLAESCLPAILPLKEVMHLTVGQEPGGSHHPHYVRILHEPQAHTTLTLGPSGPGQPTGPGIPGTPGGPGLPFKDQEQKSRYFSVFPSSQEHLRS